MRQINPLNILLFSMITALAFYAYASFYGIRMSLPAFEQKKASEKQDIKTAPNQQPSIAEYALIPEQNLFHPERKIPPEKKSEQQLPKPEFVLYGTLITDDAKTAYLEDLKAPHTTAGRGKRQRTLQLGQSISGYVVKEIHHDKVIMARGDETLEVKINTNKRVKTGDTAVQPASGGTTSSADQPVTTAASTKEKRGGGQPPGIVHTEPPPAGVPIPDARTTSKVKEAFGTGLMKRPGVQRQTEKPQ